MFIASRLLIVASLLTISACANGAEDRVPLTDLKFPTVAFARSIDLAFTQQPDVICPYFHPRWRQLLYHWWEPNVLREGSDDSLAGYIAVVEPEGHAPGTGITLIVYSHDQEQGQLKYIVHWGDYEMQQITIVCVATVEGGTDVTWNEAIVGFNEAGISPVTQFVIDGNLEKVVRAYGERIRNKIEAGK